MIQLDRTQDLEYFVLKRNADFLETFGFINRSSPAPPVRCLRIRVPKEGALKLCIKALLIPQKVAPTRGVGRFNAGVGTALRRSCQQDLRDIPGCEIQDFGVRRLALDLYRSEEHTSELQSLRHLVCR